MKQKNLIWLSIPILVILGIVGLLLFGHTAVPKQNTPAVAETPKAPLINGTVNINKTKNNEIVAQTLTKENIVIHTPVSVSNPVPAQPAPAGKILFGEVAYFIDGCSMKFSGEKEWKPVAEGQTLYETDSVRTGAKSEMEITLGNGDIIKIYPGTEITLSHLKSENSSVKPSGIMLLIGKIFFKGKPNQSNFQVETQSAVAAVRGTQFTAEFTGTKTLLAVYEGKVAVTAQNKTVLVLENQATRIELGKATEEPFDLPPAPDNVKVDVKTY